MAFVSIGNEGHSYFIAYHLSNPLNKKNKKSCKLSQSHNGPTLLQEVNFWLLFKTTNNQFNKKLSFFIKVDDLFNFSRYYSITLSLNH